MRVVSPSAKRGFLGIGLVAAFLVVAALSSRSSTAGPDPDEVRVLVKCKRKALPDLVRIVEGHGGEAWDLATMERLRASPPKEPSTPAPAAIPVLPDATRVMYELLTSVTGVREDLVDARVEAEEVIVQEARTIMKCTASDPAAFDRIREVLARNEYLSARAREPKRMIEVGAQLRLPGGRLRQSFMIGLDDVGLRDAPRLPEDTTLPQSQVNEALLDCGMRLTYAGPVRNDPNHLRGYRTVSREFTLAPSRLATFTKLLARLPERAPDFTVTELRWKRADPEVRAEKGDDMLGKTVVTLAARLPLGD